MPWVRMLRAVRDYCGVMLATPLIARALVLVLAKLTLVLVTFVATCTALSEPTSEPANRNLEPTARLLVTPVVSVTIPALKAMAVTGIGAAGVVVVLVETGAAVGVGLVAGGTKAFCKAVNAVTSSAVAVLNGAGIAEGSAEICAACD